MKTTPALIRTLVILGPMAVALSVGAASGSYAEVTTPGSTCSPFFNDPSCADVSPVVVVKHWTDWTPRRVVAHEDARPQAIVGHDRGLDSDLGHSGSNLNGPNPSNGGSSLTIDGR